MYAVCIESSHRRGMGHFYRALNLMDALRRRGAPSRVFINGHEPALGELRSRAVPHTVVSYENGNDNWEARLIRQYGISVWVNDRLDTDLTHAKRVREAGVKLVTFDDHGAGATLADLHFAALAFNDRDQLQGDCVFTGPDYLILNPEIDRFKRHRVAMDNLLVTMGGTDTYGVTIKVAQLLKRRHRPATIVVGPGFQHEKELRAVADESMTVKFHVPSLIREFEDHNVAVTGGGLTAFEAAASGLPTIIVANELFEVPAAEYLESLGCCCFAGHHQHLREEVFDLALNVSAMSWTGMNCITTAGVGNVVRELLEL